MALRYGFFNSIDGDRKYDALDMSSIFDGIIEDGVFATIGKMFAVTPGEGLQVLVDTGKAWFNHTWTTNDAQIPLTIETPDITLDRYDAIILEVNNDEGVRANSIKVLKGSAASEPQKPSAEKGETINQHILAYVLVKHGASSISPQDIEITVGKSECPFVTGPLETVPIDDLFQRWEAEFDEWFENIQSQLEGDVVTNLQRQIDERVKISDKASDDELNDMTNDNKWMTPLMTGKAIESSTFQIGDIRTSVRDLETESSGKYLTCDGRSIDSEAYPDLAKVLNGRFGYNASEKSYVVVPESSGGVAFGGSVIKDDGTEAAVCVGDSTVYRYRVTNGQIMVDQELSKCSLPRSGCYLCFYLSDGLYSFVYNAPGNRCYIYKISSDGRSASEIATIDDCYSFSLAGMYLEADTMYIGYYYSPSSYSNAYYGVAKVQSGTASSYDLKSNVNKFQALLYNGYMYFVKEFTNQMEGTWEDRYKKIPVGMGAETDIDDPEMKKFLDNAFNNAVQPQGFVNSRMFFSPDTRSIAIYSYVNATSLPIKCFIFDKNGKYHEYPVVFDIDQFAGGSHAANYIRFSINNDGVPICVYSYYPSNGSDIAAIQYGFLCGNVIRISERRVYMEDSSKEYVHILSPYYNTPSNILVLHASYRSSSSRYEVTLFSIFLDSKKPRIPNRRFSGQTGDDVEYIKAKN